MFSNKTNLNPKPKHIRAVHWDLRCIHLTNHCRFQSRQAAEQLSTQPLDYSISNLLRQMSLRTSRGLRLYLDAQEMLLSSALPPEIRDYVRRRTDSTASDEIQFLRIQNVLYLFVGSRPSSTFGWLQCRLTPALFENQTPFERHYSSCLLKNDSTERRQKSKQASVAVFELAQRCSEFMEEKPLRTSQHFPDHNEESS